MSLLPLFGAVFLGALLVTWVLQKHASRLRLLDAPVARSAHSLPTPKGGGLSICLTFGLSILYFYLNGTVPEAEFLALSGTLLVATLGLLDDVRSLRLRWRLPLQFCAAGWVIFFLGGVAPIHFGLFVVSNQLTLSVMGIFALVWLLNLYNFMDGIDGIATAELLFVNVMSLFLVINSNDQLIGLISSILLFSGAGFLVWNWPPAKIFLGDVGSNFIGFVLGIVALISMKYEIFTVWTWFILLGVFVVDTAVTLIVRILRGDNWYEGHASHAYQNAARRYKSHAKVTIRVIGVNCLWLAPMAWLSVQRPVSGPLLCLIALSPLVFLALKLEAGKVDPLR